MPLEPSSIPARTPSLAIAAITSLALAACGSHDAAANGSSSANALAGASGGTALSPARSGTCGLLTISEAQAAFPDVTIATPYTDLENVGIHACDFGSKADKRVFQVRESKSSVEEEMVTFEMGVMDPAKNRHLKRDPFGAGGKVIVSEQGKTPDALGDIGVAALQKGANTIVVSTGTVTGGRDAVEKHLIALVIAAERRAP